jgi:hypothetical protein
MSFELASVKFVIINLNGVSNRSPKFLKKRLASAPPPSIVPRRRPKKGVSETTGSQHLSSAHSIGKAAGELRRVSVGKSVHVECVTYRYNIPYTNEA